MTVRREILKSTVAVAGLALAGALAEAAEKEKPTTANEDLMREHSVLRRAMLVYGEAAQRLLHGSAPFPAAALQKTARLFREFGEDYHERKLEEKFIFPAVRKLKGSVARLPDILEQQHERGRELTDYVLHATSAGKIASADAALLAKALQQFNLMYEHHAAREDTDVFTAWKESLSDKAYKEMGERFESIEKQIFGHDGFEDAVKNIATIEAELGLSDLARFTMPAPPK